MGLGIEYEGGTVKPVLVSRSRLPTWLGLGLGSGSGLAFGFGSG